MAKKKVEPAPAMASRAAVEVDPTLDMLPGDRALYESPMKFLGGLDFVVDGKPLRDWAPRSLLADAIGWTSGFIKLARVSKVRLARAVEKAAAEVILIESGFLAREIDLAIQLAAVRHPELTAKLAPKSGQSNEQHLDNLLGMRARLDSNAEYLAHNEIVIKLEPRHETAAVEQQATLHQSAAKTVKKLKDAGGGEVSALNAARKQAPKLQTKINRFLNSLLGDDRATAHDLGLEERAKARPQKKPQEGSAATDKKGAKEKSSGKGKRGAKGKKNGKGDAPPGEPPAADMSATSAETGKLPPEAPGSSPKPPRPTA